jgi:hypothetical protein
MFPKHHEQKFARWIKWIKRIEGDINRQQVFHYYFALLNDIWKHNPKLPPSNFPEFFAAMYAESQGASVRRLVETDPRDKPFSLALLLKDIAQYPDVMSKERFLSIWGITGAPKDFWDQHLVKDATEVWTKNWGEGDQIEPPVVERDLQLLIDAAVTIKTWVDKHIAHSDPSGMDKVPTFGDLHSAVRAIYDTFRKYASLLTGADRAVKVPVFQYNQLEFFEVPWVPEGYSLPDAEKLVAGEERA